MEEPSTASGPEPTIQQMVDQTIKANMHHQVTLTKYRELLQKQLDDIDERLDILDDADEELEDEKPNINVGGHIDTSQFKKPTGPFFSSELLSAVSPFYNDASHRERYWSMATPHTFKRHELAKLSQAVQTDNARIQAFANRRREINHEPYLAEANSKTTEIDWERVAEGVPERTALECRIQWLGSCDPKFTRGKWTQAEIAKVKKIVANQMEDPINWVKVAEELGGNRPPIECMTHGQRRAVQTFNEEVDQRMLDNVKIYGIDNWPLVAKHLSENAGTSQCQHRYFSTVNPELKRGAWTEEETERLRLAVAGYGKTWVDVSTAIPGRTNAQCRDRWVDRVDPDLNRSNWSDDEDAKLCEAVASIGERWQKIAEQLGIGRTDQHCRVRFEKLLKNDPTLDRGPLPPGGQESRRRSVSVVERPSQSRASPSSTAFLPLNPVTSVDALAPASPSSQTDAAEGSTRRVAKPKPKPRGRRKPPVAVTSTSTGTGTGTGIGDPTVDNDDTIPSAKGKGKAKPRPRPVKKPSTKRSVPEGSEDPPPPKKRRTGKAKSRPIVEEEEAEGEEEAAVVSVEAEGNATDTAAYTASASGPTQATPVRGTKSRQKSSPIKAKTPPVPVRRQPSRRAAPR